MIGVGVVAFVIVILIVMAIIIYNTQRELSALKKEDTLLVKAIKKITNKSTKFVSDKLELDTKLKSEPTTSHVTDKTELKTDKTESKTELDDV